MKIKSDGTPIVSMDSTFSNVVPLGQILRSNQDATAYVAASGAITASGVTPTYGIVAVQYAEGYIIAQKLMDDPLLISITVLQQKIRWIQVKTEKGLLLEGRELHLLTDYFKKFKDRKNVKYFVVDMWQPYKDINETYFKNATIVIDKYNFVRQVIWAFERVRTE